MSTAVTFLGMNGHNLAAAVAALKARGNENIRVYDVKSGSPDVGVEYLPPPAPGGLAEALSGDRLVIIGPLGGAEEVARRLGAAIEARVPALLLTERMGVVEAARRHHDAARAHGLPVIVAGGLVPGLGAWLAGQTLAKSGDAGSLTLTYARRGLSGAASPCLKGLSSQPAAHWSGGRWRPCAPASSPRPVQLPEPLGAGLAVAVAPVDLVGLVDGGELKRARAQLALCPAALGAGLWGLAQLPSAWVAGGQASEGRASGPVAKLARQLVSPLQADDTQALLIDVEVRGAWSTRRLRMVSTDPAQLMGASIAAMAEQLLAWQPPLGVSTAAALDAAAYEATLMALGVAPPQSDFGHHTASGREARRLHILAP